MNKNVSIYLMLAGALFLGLGIYHLYIDNESKEHYYNTLAVIYLVGAIIYNKK